MLACCVFKNSHFLKYDEEQPSFYPGQVLPSNVLFTDDWAPLLARRIFIPRIFDRQFLASVIHRSTQLDGRSQVKVSGSYPAKRTQKDSVTATKLRRPICLLLRQILTGSRSMLLEATKQLIWGRDSTPRPLLSPRLISVTVLPLWGSDCDALATLFSETKTRSYKKYKSKTRLYSGIDQSVKLKLVTWLIWSDDFRVE